jgi:hypothetical protein
MARAEDDWSRRIFGFWTGDNAMSDNRKRGWDSFPTTGLEPILVTAHTLDRWTVPEHPLHEAYEFLSPTHRADYLRPYFMYFHGGGYADIKVQRESWSLAVERLLRSKRLIAAGYREVRGGTVWLQDNRVHGKVYVLSRAVPNFVVKFATNAMRAARPLMIGNGAYYFKPGSAFARLWLAEAERRLDMLLPDLRRNPARDARDRQGSGSGYPVPWSFILGDIFHPLSLAFSPFLSRDLPRPAFENYL